MTSSPQVRRSRRGVPARFRNEAGRLVYATRRGCMVAAFLAAGLAIIAGAVWIAMSRNVPSDSPLARMYRTEADLAALMKAVNAYHEQRGVYPPSGPEGLRMACESASNKADYYPGGPRPDAWGRPFRYVAYTEYAEPGSAALKGGAGYYAADAFQLYSVGSDGDAGIDDAGKQKDNIVSWDPSRSWRLVYHEYQATFMNDHRKRP